MTNIHDLEDIDADDIMFDYVVENNTIFGGGNIYMDTQNYLEVIADSDGNILKCTQSTEDEFMNKLDSWDDTGLIHNENYKIVNDRVVPA